LNNYGFTLSLHAAHMPHLMSRTVTIMAHA
jgi:hypothetical protein